MTPISPTNRPTSAGEIAASVMDFVDRQVSQCRLMTWTVPEAAAVVLPDCLSLLPDDVASRVARAIYRASDIESTCLLPIEALRARYVAAGWYVRVEAERGVFYLAPAIEED